MNGPRVRVDLQLVFGVSLLVALAISWPGFSGAMNGTADIVTVGIRFLVVVGAAWVGIYGVASLIAAYASNPQGADRAAAPVAADRRRASDRAAATADVRTAVEPDTRGAVNRAAAIAVDTEHAAG